MQIKDQIQHVQLPAGVLQTRGAGEQGMLRECRPLLHVKPGWRKPRSKKHVPQCGENAKHTRGAPCRA